jgi:hypothetical protein
LVVFEGDGLDYPRKVMGDEILSDPVQMQAVVALTRFKHPTLAMSAVKANINVLALALR